MGIVLLGIGVVVGLVGGIMLLIKAFQASVWWGLGSLFVPFVSLIFVISHWQVAKKPFLISLISVPFVVVGMTMMPHSQMSMIPQ